MPKVSKKIKIERKKLAKDAPFNKEEKIFARYPECRYIIGIDESGAGPLAGDVIVTAFAHGRNASYLEGIRDSKKTTKVQRKKLAPQLKSHPETFFHTVSIDCKKIDEINILEARKKGMIKAAKGVIRIIQSNENYKNNNDNLISEASNSTEDPLKAQQKPEFHILIDGNFIPEHEIFETYKTKCIIEGDSKCYSIAAASILAKYEQAKRMAKHHETYPEYHFDRHCGYGTKLHQDMLEKYGTCPIHRLSFKTKRLGLLGDLEVCE